MFCSLMSRELLEHYHLPFGFPVYHRPKLSVVVVKKRIASRFFAFIGGKTVNPPPGTVVDTEVTRPEW